MPRAAQLLTQEDWAAITAAVPASPDPLFGENVEERFAKHTSKSVRRDCPARTRHIGMRRLTEHRDLDGFGVGTPTGIGGLV